MAEKVSRFHVHHGKEMHVDLNGAYVRYSEIKSLHADIIDQGRKVQIGASGESKYGAMSAGEYIEWALGKLEGK